MTTKYLNAKNGIEIWHDDGITQILAGSSNPSITGFDADIGALYIHTISSGILYKKQGVGLTDWTGISSSVTNLEYYYEESLFESSTTSSGYQNKVTLSGVHSGDFLFMWCFEWSVYNESTNMLVSVNLNTTSNIVDYELVPENKNMWCGIAGFRKLTIPYDNSNIILSYSSSKVGKQVCIKNSCFNVWRL